MQSSLSCFNALALEPKYDIFSCLGVLVKHKWENCFTIDKHAWTYRRNVQLSDYMSPDDLIKELVSTVRCKSLIKFTVTH